MIMSGTATWTYRAFRVGDRQVTASIRLLGVEQREQTAASVAWLASLSTRTGDPNASVWRTLVEDVLGPHVELTVDHDEPEQLDRAWWNETIRQVAAAFIQVNRLGPLIARSPLAGTVPAGLVL